MAPRKVKKSSDAKIKSKTPREARGDKGECGNPEPSLKEEISDNVINANNSNNVNEALRRLCETIAGLVTQLDVSKEQPSRQLKKKRTSNTECSSKEFLSNKPPQYQAKNDSTTITDWTRDMECLKRKRDDKTVEANSKEQCDIYSRNKRRNCGRCGKYHTGRKCLTSKCYHCGKEGHIAQNCYDKDERCYICQSLNHLATFCLKNAPANILPWADQIAINKAKKGKNIEVEKLEKK